MAPKEREPFLASSHSENVCDPSPEVEEPPQFPGVVNWMRVKRQKDDIGDEKLWRIHDHLYDLSQFVDKHPGGSHWLELTRGCDITESFETSHVFGDKVDKLLEKYRVRKCEKPRSFRFTFKEDGFYKTLKRRAEKVLKEVGTGPTTGMLILHDVLALSFLLSLPMTVKTSSLLWLFCSGITLGMTAVLGHNFFHQKDNFRAYYFDLTVMNSSDWRVSHVLSHHVYTNTFSDYELTALYPFVSFFARPKNIVHKYLSPIYVHFFYAMIPMVQYILKIFDILRGVEKISVKDIMPLMELAAFVLFSQLTFNQCVFYWLGMQAIAGYWLIITSIIATHHDTWVYHPGDHPRPETDWGLHQMDATRDMDKISLGGFFFSATTFGDHHLHHLFPTVDHSKLHYLYPVFRQTCKDFGFTFDFNDPLGAAKGMHAMLSREDPSTFKERREGIES